MMRKHAQHAPTQRRCLTCGSCLLSPCLPPQGAVAQQQLPSDPVTNLIYVKELMFNPFAYAWRSWLPLYAGEATLYTDACPAMPWFLAGALVAARVRAAAHLLHGRRL